MNIEFELCNRFDAEKVLLNSYKNEKRNGFLIYSKKTIKDLGLTNLYKKSYKNIEEMKEGNAFRYYYLERLNNGCEKHAVIIMMNPAFANSDEPDRTIKNIKKYCEETKAENNIGSFEIINLYPIRMPKSVKLSELLENEAVKKETGVYQESIKNYLKDLLIKKEKNCIIIAAWGTKDADNDKAKKMFEELDLTLYCYAINEKGYPRHFRSLKNKELKKLQEFKFD